MSGEEGGSIRRGEDADLSNLRATLSNGNSDTQETKAALEQLLDASKEERILHNLVAIQASLTGSDDDDDVNVDDSQVNEIGESTNDFSKIAGYTCVTSEQIIFLARDATHAAHDLAIDAACIDLHAVQQEPVVSVYIQITNPDAKEEASPLELTLEPNIGDDADADGDDDDDTFNRESVSQTIFDALSALVSLHPLDPNDDMMDTGGGFAGGGAGAMGGEWMGADGIMDDDDVDDMMVMRAPGNGSGNDGSDRERQAMLERLDNMLLVPDDLVVAEDNNNGDAGVVDGQFDDAEEDEDDAIL
jgi:hypothetical protein